MCDRRRANYWRKEQAIHAIWRVSNEDKLSSIRRGRSNSSLVLRKQEVRKSPYLAKSQPLLPLRSSCSLKSRKKVNRHVLWLTMGQSLLLPVEVAALQNQICAIIRILRSRKGKILQISNSNWQLWLYWLSAFARQSKGRPQEPKAVQKLKSSTERMIKTQVFHKWGLQARVTPEVAQPFLKLKNQAWKSHWACAIWKLSDKLILH